MKRQDIVAAVRQIAESLDPRITEAAARFEIEVGEDWRGAPAVFVTVVLKDERAYYVWPYRDEFRRSLRDRLFDVLPEDHYPFIAFSAESAALNPEIAPA